MPRRARLSIPDVPHHVCHRSLDGKLLFESPEDYKEYLGALQTEMSRYGCDVLAYCLLPERVHLLVVPRKKGALAKGVGRIHFWYAQYRNRNYQEAGKLWHDRFYSCPVDPSCLENAIHYVEYQPVLEKVVRKPARFAWSSAKCHLTGVDAFDVICMTNWHKRKQKKWATTLANKLDKTLCDELHLNTKTGRPWGSDAFITKLETTLKQRLRALPVGRPPALI